MVDLSKIARKWQGKWQEAKIFEVDPIKGKKKFFVTFPYPYINLYPHIGHFYSIMRTEAFIRYKRMQGFNALFPQAWHCTGSPIANAAVRIREREPRQIQTMKDMGFKDDEIKRFEDVLARSKDVDEAITEFRRFKDNPKTRTNHNGNGKFLVAKNEAELIQKLQDGWELVRPLKNNKFLIQYP